MAATTTFINNLLEAAFQGDTYTGGTISMGLFRTGLPSATGVEVSGSGYERQELTFSAAASKSIAISPKAAFSDLPISITIVAYGIYDGTTLIYEDTLPTPFEPDVTNNELEIGFSFNLAA